MDEDKPFETLPPIRPGDKILRLERKPPKKLRIAPNVNGIVKFVKAILTQTPFLPILSILITLWLVVALALLIAEASTNKQMDTYGDTLLWCLTAIQTMGSPHGPITAFGKVIHAFWIVSGTMLFWGAIIASVTSYFMQPRQHPTKQIITTVQYNLGILDELSPEELKILKETAIGLIDTRLEQIRQASK